MRAPSENAPEAKKAGAVEAEDREAATTKAAVAWPSFVHTPWCSFYIANYCSMAYSHVGLSATS